MYRGRMSRWRLILTIGVVAPAMVAKDVSFGAAVANAGDHRGMVEGIRASNSETSLIFVALYNKQYPRRALGVFDSCAAAQARGNELYIQITCQPLSFDFRLASAYPFYSHPAFDAIKAHDREQLIDGVR